MRGVTDLLSQPAQQVRLHQRELLGPDRALTDDGENSLVNLPGNTAIGDPVTHRITPGGLDRPEGRGGGEGGGQAVEGGADSLWLLARSQLSDGLGQWR